MLSIGINDYAHFWHLLLSILSTSNIYICIYYQPPIYIYMYISASNIYVHIISLQYIYVHIISLQYIYMYILSASNIYICIYYQPPIYILWYHCFHLSNTGVQAIQKITFHININIDCCVFILTVCQYVNTGLPRKDVTIKTRLEIMIKGLIRASQI